MTKMSRGHQQPYEALLPSDFDFPGPGGKSKQTSTTGASRMKSLVLGAGRFFFRTGWNYLVKPMALIAVVGWATSWIFPSLLVGLGLSALTHLSASDMSSIAESAADLLKNLIGSS